LIIGSNAVQAAITLVDAPVRPEITAALLFVDLSASFSLFLTSRPTGKPLNEPPRPFPERKTTQECRLAKSRAGPATMLPKE
jgi:hypothetical protein